MKVFELFREYEECLTRARIYEDAARQVSETGWFKSPDMRGAGACWRKSMSLQERAKEIAAILDAADISVIDAP